MIEEKPLTPGADNSGSRKTPDHAVSQMGTSETGRGAVKQNAIKSERANPVGKLSKKECGYQKTDFRP